MRPQVRAIGEQSTDQVVDGGVPALAPFYLEAALDPSRAEGAPLGGQTRFQLPDNHLGYAFTWYALAIALAVIFVLSQRAGNRP